MKQPMGRWNNGVNGQTGFLQNKPERKKTQRDRQYERKVKKSVNKSI